MTIEEIARSLQIVADSQAAMAAAQLAHEGRTSRLEEAFEKIALAIQHFSQLAANHEERLDDVEEKHIHTDARLDALIDSQMRTDERVRQIDDRLNLVGEHLDGVTLRLDALAIQVAQNSEQINALILAQSRTDEQIKQLLARNGNGQKSS